MKNIKGQYLKVFIIGIFVLLLFIAYQLYSQKNDTPKTKLDCLKLGSNERAALCLKLLESQEQPVDFPIYNLTIEDAKAEDIGCIKVSGTVLNNYSLPAQYITLRVNFTKSEFGEPFHYEVFSPFESEGEQVQPNSKKTFSKCLRQQSFNAVRDIDNWYFSITPYEAKIYQE